MKPVMIALLGLLFFACDAAAADTPPNPPPSGRVQQQRIASISQPAEVLISDDLAHVAVIDQHGRRQRLTVDGKVGPESDVLRFVSHDGPLFDRDVPVLYALRGPRPLAARRQWRARPRV